MNDPPPRNPQTEARLIAIACSLIAILAATLVVGSILAANTGKVSVLVRMSISDDLLPVAQQNEPHFAVTPNVVHYDGVYYYAIALDPFALGQEHELIDLAAHRYGHPAYGWLAGLVSFGQKEWIPEALLALSIAGLAVGAYVTSRLANVLEIGSPWMGLLVALNPGLLFAVAADTSEAVSTAVLALALWFWLRNKRRLALPFLVLLCFLKFQLVLVPVGLGLWELVHALRKSPKRIPWRTLVLLATGPILFGLWQIYVYLRLEQSATALGPDLLSIPPLGFLTVMGQLGHINQLFNGDAQVIAAQLPILVGVFGLFVVALVRSLRLRNAIDSVFALQAVLFLALNYWNLFYPKELIRVMAIPAILLVVVLASNEKAQRIAHASTAH